MNYWGKNRDHELHKLGVSDAVIKSLGMIELCIQDMEFVLFVDDRKCHWSLRLMGDWDWSRKCGNLIHFRIYGPTKRMWVTCSCNLESCNTPKNDELVKDLLLLLGHSERDDNINIIAITGDGRYSLRSLPKYCSLDELTMKVLLGRSGDEPGVG